MSCTINSINIDCDLSGVGGIQKFWVKEVSTIDFTTDPSDGEAAITNIEIDGSALDASGLTAQGFSEFAGLRGTAQLNETLSMGDRGSVLYNQVLTGGFPKISKEKQSTLNAMSKKPILCVIALDYNGHYWMIGNQQGAYLSAANNASGLNAADQNGLQIEISGFSGEPMFEITDI